MNQAKKVELKMKKYGVRTTLPKDGREFYAFIQPLRYKSKMYLETVKTPIGDASESRFLYIGPASVDVTLLDETDVIRSNGMSYYFVIAEPVWFSDEVIYYRAVLKKAREAE